MPERSDRRLHTLVTRATAGLRLLMLFGLAAACGGSRSTDTSLSAQEHREAAQRDEVEALTHQNLAQGGRYQVHEAQAQLQRTHAEQHRAAAAALEGRADAECSGVPPEATTSCPLETPDYVVLAEEVEGGVRLILAAPETSLIRAETDCHEAHAALLGYDEMTACVFGLEDIDVSVDDLGEGQSELRITSSDPAVVTRIRALTVDMWQEMPITG